MYLNFELQMCFRIGTSFYDLVLIFKEFNPSWLTRRKNLVRAATALTLEKVALISNRET